MEWINTGTFALSLVRPNKLGALKSVEFITGMLKEALASDSSTLNTKNNKLVA